MIKMPALEAAKEFLEELRNTKQPERLQILGEWANDMEGVV